LLHSLAFCNLASSIILSSLSLNVVFGIGFTVGRPQPRQLDGDPISAGRELRAEVQAGVLLVRVPRTVSR